MGTLTSNTPLILALVAVATVVVNLVGLYLQSRRDSSDYLSKRIEEAAKISSVSSEMVQPLRTELAEVRKENTATKVLVSSQVDQIERMQASYDEQHAELRATKADRDNLLTQRIMWQKKVEMVLSERDGLQERIAELETKVAGLEAELGRLKAEKEQGDFDPREFMSDE